MNGIRILGPLEIEGSAGLPRISSYRQRAILARLALNANGVTSIGSLVDAIWDGHPPTTARSQIQAGVSRLRRVIAESGCQASIETRPPGYRLVIRGSDLDSLRFVELTNVARSQESKGRLVAALTTLKCALGIWRGLVLADVSSTRLQQAAYRLTEQRLSAQLSRFRIELELGRAVEVTPDLYAHVEQYPLDEEIYRYLMLSLYMSGRSAEALKVFRQARKTLIERVGIEPSEPLRRLEQAILRRDSELLRSMSSGLAMVGNR
ncbi:MAG: AfsR/SARP family transcriptional regulator [Actinomycetota bacterium]|nr:AfsR/SARP family transcriptional regulator [Actinomycetota bacterium]